MTTSNPTALSGAQIREKFLAFFESKGHARKASASLVPTNDTVLLTPAGMLPFVSIFLGVQPAPTPPRATSSQKCARVSGKASDLENVGRTPHHHTFFEMLGNFSFGDYFKADAIAYAWEFLTGDQWLNLPKDRLWVSVFKTEKDFDQEAFDIWTKTMGVPESRVLFRDEKDNFWGPPGPTGPCGPCSEIYYDWDPTGASPKEHPELVDDAKRMVEIWNLVFMELFQDANGKRTPLEKKNIDTGMGLERITQVIQQKANTSETDLLMPIINTLSAICGIPYGQSYETDVALKVCADHARFVVFALADGIRASNEGRGYVVRMVLRRAVRYKSRFLTADNKQDGPFLSHLVDILVVRYSQAYPELFNHQEAIKTHIRQEEEQFFKTLNRGIEIFEAERQQLQANKKTMMDGAFVFKLYDTYGFPKELTQDLAEENGLTIDDVGFEVAMVQQKDQARAARKGGAIVEDQLYSQILAEVGATQFLGYDTLTVEDAQVLALIQHGQRVAEVSGTNEPFQVILDRTPFYAESGGQVGDRGTFSRQDGHHGLTVVVKDTQKVGELFVHHCLFDNGGIIRQGETLEAHVEPVYRQLSAIHHTATHLLNAALRKVLGDEITQAGSYVSPESARFDFNFSRAMEPVEIQRVEYFINTWIQENLPKELQLMDVASAKAYGAIAMAGEDYGDEVRVIGYGERSKELCGGTHVGALGEIGMVKIISESSIAAGVRRIELVAGERAYKAFKRVEGDLEQVARLLKTPIKEVPLKVERLMDELKSTEKTLQTLQAQLAAVTVDQLLATVDSVQPVPLITQLDGQTAEQLKLIAEQLVDKLSHYVIVLGANTDGKAVFVSAVSDDHIKAGVKAGELVKLAANVCQGGGGGKPNFAQAGGKDGAMVTQALQTVSQHLAQPLPTA